jgi:Protein of unknown function (DUF3311)
VSGLGEAHREPATTSTPGGEVVRYMGRHGTRRVAKVALISAIAPLMLKNAANPGGAAKASAIAILLTPQKLPLPISSFPLNILLTTDNMQGGLWIAGLGAAYPDGPRRRNRVTTPTPVIKGMHEMRLLLALPFLGLLWTPFYNQDLPALFGFPFFYWYQFLWVPLASLIIGMVYLHEKKRGAQ